MNNTSLPMLNMHVTIAVVELDKFAAELKRTGEVNSDLAARLSSASHDLYRVWCEVQLLMIGGMISPKPTPQPASDAMPDYTGDAMDSSDPILRRVTDIDNIFYSTPLLKELDPLPVDHDSIS